MHDRTGLWILIYIYIVFDFDEQFEQEADVDVNTVGFIDETSNIIYSGSDTGIIKVPYISKDRKKYSISRYHSFSLDLHRFGIVDV